MFCLREKRWSSGNDQIWAFDRNPSETKVRLQFFYINYEEISRFSVRLHLLPLYRFLKGAQRHISAWNPWDHRVWPLSTGGDEETVCYSSSRAANSWILSTHTLQPTSYHSHAVQTWIYGYYLKHAASYKEQLWPPCLIWPQIPSQMYLFRVVWGLYF